MQIPTSDMILMAADRCAKRNAHEVGSQVRELEEAAILAIVSQSLIFLTPWEQGYLLGLETARIMLELNPLANANGITL